MVFWVSAVSQCNLQLFVPYSVFYEDVSIISVWPIASMRLIPLDTYPASVLKDHVENGHP